ncbi:MAG TPA: hypothetical protein VNK92_01125 [Vicinamibacterales bacterium]|nr:hypothetical protein [Vicinamibacterales bacterium]
MSTTARLALLDSWSGADWGDGVQVEQLGELERLLVRTRHSIYEIVVLPGGTGEVLVRGGRYFPAFTRALLDGSSAGGTFLKQRGIYRGLRLEFVCGARRVITSPVEAVTIAPGGAEPGGRPVM